MRNQDRLRLRDIQGAPLAVALWVFLIITLLSHIGA
jgi:Tfp pilus assembly protein PilX